MTAYALVERRGGEVVACAARPRADTLRCAVSADDREAPRALAGDLLPYLLPADVVLTYGPALADLLSLPAVLADARETLGRLVDAREASLLVAAGLRQSGLRSVCEALGTSPPDVEDPAAFLAQWQDLAAALRGRGRALPAKLAGCLAEVMGPAWPEAVLDRVLPPAKAAAALAAILPPLPPRVRREPRPASQDLQGLATAFLAPDGSLAAQHPAYEHRAGQIVMARAVAAAFEREELLLVEAGTGIGKSLAYLISAVRHARATRKPVVVSTNTKNLQDQLADRDLPLLRSALDLEFASAVLKGRANYLCPLLLAAAADRVRDSVFRDERLALAHLLAWAAAVPLADFETLSSSAYEAVPALRQTVERLRARSEACSGRRCSFFGTCPAEVARRRAQNADVVVVNHALRLVGGQDRLLPEHDCLILDEAHNLEDVATDQFSLEASGPSVRALLRLLAGDNQGHAIADRLAEHLPAALAVDDEVLVEIDVGLRQGAARLEYALEDLAVAVISFAERTPGSRGEEDTRKHLRVTADTRASPAWEGVAECTPGVLQAADDVSEQLRRAAQVLADAGPQLPEELVLLQLDLQYLLLQVAGLQAALRVVVEGGQDREYVSWAERWPARVGETAWALRAAPIDVGPLLAEALYREAKTVVLTSATLTVDQSFDYLRRRLGLEADRDRLAELTVPSPFDLPAQLLLAIPTDMPLPDEERFPEASQEAILAAAQAAGGGTLCLFTSRDSMVRAREALMPRFSDGPLTLLCQGVDGSRTALLDQLRADPQTVLFGLKSFWEGIDVPGEALRCLVIAKLPFAVPSDPVIEARQERVAEEGYDGYEDYYVPNAVISFRQGVGRVIRTRSDLGAVLVLDRRVLVRRYGHRFLDSIPACQVVRARLDRCIDAIEAHVGRAFNGAHLEGTP
jgi:Rad3-related DNA helicase